MRFVHDRRFVEPSVGDRYTQLDWSTRRWFSPWSILDYVEGNTAVDENLPRPPEVIPPIQDQLLKIADALEAAFPSFQPFVRDDGHLEDRIRDYRRFLEKRAAGTLQILYRCTGRAIASQMPMKRLINGRYGSIDGHTEP